MLASHGTPGARAAESYAIARAAHGRGRLVHLYVVPDFWGGMKGDDWLNSPRARNDFGEYLEGELTREAEAEISRVKQKAAAAGVKDTAVRLMHGRPAECLLRVAEEEGVDMVVMGAPRPKGMAGYRSRMALEPLVRGLSVPLIVVPIEAAS